MSCIVQFFHVWGSMISTLALVATMVIIIWYTIETRRLRQAAVKQNELSLRPFVIISIFVDPAGPSQRMVYKNIGHSPAIDIWTEPFDAGAYILDFKRYGLIETGEWKDLDPSGKGKTAVHDGFIQAVQTPSFTPTALDERGSNLELVLNIHYANLEKVNYRTTTSISRKGIEIQSTDRILIS